MKAEPRERKTTTRKIKAFIPRRSKQEELQYYISTEHELRNEDTRIFRTAHDKNVRCVLPEYLPLIWNYCPLVNYISREHTSASLEEIAEKF